MRRDTNSKLYLTADLLLIDILCNINTDFISTNTPFTPAYTLNINV